MPETTQPHDGDKLENNTIATLQGKVIANKLHHSESVWKPEMDRLANLIADKIASEYANLPEGQEVEIAEFTGFPGLNELQELRSSEAMGYANIAHDLPDRVVELLRRPAIKAEIIISTDSKRFKEDADLTVRFFKDHDDNGGFTGFPVGSYKKSILHCYVSKVKPVEKKKTQRVVDSTEKRTRNRLLGALGGAALIGAVGVGAYLATNEQPSGDNIGQNIAPDNNDESKFLTNLKEGDKIFVNGKSYTYVRADNIYFPNYIWVKEKSEPFSYKENKFRKTN